MTRSREKNWSRSCLACKEHKTKTRENNNKDYWYVLLVGKGKFCQKWLATHADITLQFETSLLSIYIHLDNLVYCLLLIFLTGCFWTQIYASISLFDTILYMCIRYCCFKIYFFAFFRKNTIRKTCWLMK